ncbi:ABC transporter permease [Corynebacterium kroppenstedtii]|uniref:Putative membrane protein n=1 Tax=Corynebacterium kroppenstedtii (strain DSM 44385 / JCM 11950 / CIP 105744 / CCUG 35717) TaxID=645127 RepID=C4LKD7_CORK4|nr:ABC transporter permease [Corynebacterium kroppenstedtii]ACR18292.1 putative membrane protein [Corynebacterium kroppenstedtii DSM 44385]
MAMNSGSTEVTTKSAQATTHATNTTESTTNQAPNNATNEASTNTSKTTEHTSAGKVVGIVLGLPAIVTLMLLSFLAPAVNSGAKDLPLAVSGPDQAVNQLTQNMEHNEPGVFEIKHVDDAKQVVHDREAIGGIALGQPTAGPNGTPVPTAEVITATGAGTTYLQVMNGVTQTLTAQGAQVTTTDVAPPASGDEHGTAFATLALPMAFGGMISAVVLSTQVRGGRTRRFLACGAFAIIAGFILAAVMRFGFDVVDGSYWEIVGTLSLAIVGVSMFVLGMESKFGYAGLGIGAVFVMFLSNPLSGMQTGPDWLPSPWGTIGQFLPLGAAGSALRSVGFFDGAGWATHGIVLACWALLGIALAGWSAWTASRRSH